MGRILRLNAYTSDDKVLYLWRDDGLCVCILLEGEHLIHTIGFNGKFVVDDGGSF